MYLEEEIFDVTKIRDEQQLLKLRDAIDKQLEHIRKAPPKKVPHTDKLKKEYESRKGTDDPPFDESKVKCIRDNDTETESIYNDSNTSITVKTYLTVIDVLLSSIRNIRNSSRKVLP